MELDNFPLTGTTDLDYITRREPSWGWVRLQLMVETSVMQFLLRLWGGSCLPCLNCLFGWRLDNGGAVWLWIYNVSNRSLVKPAVMTNGLFPLCDGFHFLWIYSCLRQCGPHSWVVVGGKKKTEEKLRNTRLKYEQLKTVLHSERHPSSRHRFWSKSLDWRRRQCGST